MGIAWWSLLLRLLLPIVIVEVTLKGWERIVTFLFIFTILMFHVHRSEPIILQELVLNVRIQKLAWVSLISFWWQLLFKGFDLRFHFLICKHIQFIISQYFRWIRILLLIVVRLQLVLLQNYRGIKPSVRNGNNKLVFLVKQSWILLRCFQSIAVGLNV